MMPDDVWAKDVTAAIRDLPEFAPDAWVPDHTWDGPRLVNHEDDALWEAGYDALQAADTPDSSERYIVRWGWMLAGHLLQSQFEITPDMSREEVLEQALGSRKALMEYAGSIMAKEFHGAGDAG